MDEIELWKVSELREGGKKKKRRKSSIKTEVSPGFFWVSLEILSVQVELVKTIPQLFTSRAKW